MLLIDLFCFRQVQTEAHLRLTFAITFEVSQLERRNTAHLWSSLLLYYLML